MKQFLLSLFALAALAEPALAGQTITFNYQGDVVAESGENQKFDKKETIFDYEVKLTLAIKDEGNSTLTFSKNGGPDYPILLERLSPTEFQVLATEEGYVKAGSMLILNANEGSIASFEFDSWGYNGSDAVTKISLTITADQEQYFFSYYWGDDANYRVNGILNAN